MTGLALRSLVHRRTTFTATFLSVVLATGLIGSFAGLAETAGNAHGGDREMLTIMGLVVGSWGTLIALFSLTSTIGIAVGHRATEIGLIRTIGGTPRQARRMIRFETLLVALAGVALGSAIAWVGGRLLFLMLRWGDMVDGSIEYGGGGLSLVATAVGVVVVTLLAASIAGRRATRGPARLVVAEGQSGRGRMPWWRVLVGVLLVGYGTALAVLTVTVMKDSEDPYAPMQTAGSAAVVVAVGLACLAPLLLRWSALVLRPLLGAGAAGHLAGFNATRRSHLLAGALGPVIVFTATTGVLMMVGIDGRTLDAIAPDQQEADTITLLNYVVTGMIAVFAAIMVVNSLVAVTGRREAEFARLRLVGATLGAGPPVRTRGGRAGRRDRHRVRARRRAGHGGAVLDGPRRGRPTQRPAVGGAGDGCGRGRDHAHGCQPRRTPDRGLARQPGEPGGTRLMGTGAKDWWAMDLQITSLDPRPVDRDGLVERLWLTVAALGSALLGVPALVLLVLTVVSWPLVLVGVGILLISLAVPGSQLLTRQARRISGAILGEEIPEWYAEDRDRAWLARPLVWLRDKARWRDFAWLAFAATGGLVLSALPALLLSAPVTYLVLFLADPGWVFGLLLFLGGPLVLTWWLVTPALTRARAMADRGILGPSSAEELVRRVEEVTESRAEVLDENAAEIRRIERDLHDGTQARLAAIGLNVGFAETLLDSDPEQAGELLREARETAVSAMDDLRALIQGIHPPVLADLGLSEAIENLAMQIPLPVTVDAALAGHPPTPIESAAYFAVAESLANVVKHARATRAWVRLRHEDGRLRMVVGDDGVGGADPAGSGLQGLGRRLSAFDGTLSRPEPARGSDRDHDGSAMRVVVAEDETLLRDGLIRILDAHGFDIAAAVDNLPTLTGALADPTVDVAVLDVRLPPSFTNEGLVAAIEARRQRPGFPVLVLSQAVEPRYTRTLLASGEGAVGYLLKQRVTDVKAFIEAVRAVAAGGTVLDPTVVSSMLRGKETPISRLTPREQEVLTLMAEGRSNAAIAARLFVTEKAVGKHTNSIFTKLDLPQAPDDNRRVLAVLAWLDSQ